METNIFVYNELIKTVQAIVTEAVENHNLSDIVNQGRYSCREMYRAYDEKYGKGPEIRYCFSEAMKSLFPKYEDMEMISIKHGAFECSFPVVMAIGIAAKFEAMIPSKERKYIEIRKEAEDVIHSFEFELRSKNMRQVAKCVSDDNMRMVLTGVCVDLNACKIYASNSNIISSVSISVSVDEALNDSDFRPVFPAKQMAKLKPGTYRIEYLSDGNIRLSGCGVEFCADKKMNESKFPNAKNIFDINRSNYVEYGRTLIDASLVKFFESEKKIKSFCTGIAFGNDYLAAVKCGSSARVERIFKFGSTTDVVKLYSTGERMISFLKCGIDTIGITPGTNMLRGYIYDDMDIEFLICMRSYPDNNDELIFSYVNEAA